ncbi:MAG: VWA domain-containing protein [Selenomonadaceae bacterium]|nr:VWA domain-containing protein [Selenomonadaceae bacterium]
MATISNSNSNTIINGTNDVDSLTNNGGSNVTIYGYSGNDVINDYNGSNNVIIAGEDNNLVIGYSDNSTINAGSGNDTINAIKNNVIINAGDGDNVLSGEGSNTITSGKGNDTISSSFTTSGSTFINAGDGDNSIQAATAGLSPSSTVVSNATINAGSGSDTVSIVYFYNSEINTGGGDDYIGAYSNSNLTINASTGNDNITLKPIIFADTEAPTTLEARDFILYSEGDGADTIYGYSANDTIKIDSTSTPSTVASGNDIIINIGDGSIRLVNATDTAITAINSSGDIINFSEGGNTPTIPPVDTDTTVTSGWATIFASEGLTVIDNNNNVANGTDNAETIQAGTIDNTVRAVYGNGGNDTVSISGSVNGIEFSSVTLEGGEGDDSINIYGGVDGIHPSTVSIGSGIGNDTVSIYGGNEGIHGGTAGMTDRSSVSIDVGDGDDKIIIHADNDKGIDISQVTITGGIGNDLISIYGGNYGIGGQEGYGGSTVSIDGGEGADTIYISSIDTLSGVSIVAGSGDNINVGSGNANYLFNSTDAVTINGATFKSNLANTSANLVSYTEGTSIGSAWNGTVVLSGTNSLADIDGSIVSATGNYQIVDGKFAGTVEPSPTVTGGKNYDIVFIIDVSGSMNDYIADVKNNVNSFVTNLQNSGVGNIRFGLISYETDAIAHTFSNDGNNYLTSNVDEFKTAVENLPIYGSTEYGLTAVEKAMSIVSDEDNTTKRFIVVTDEDCDDRSMFNATNLDNTLKSREIVMDVVGIEGDCRTEWESLANNTNGKFYLLGSGFPSIFSEITTDIVNIVDLNLVPENQTGYFVATQNSDAYTTPIFQTTGALGNDTTVGAVNEVNVYVADSDTDRQQTVILTDGWNVTATKNADKLLINGVSATVTGGDGSDVFSLGSDTRTISLMDLNIYEDKLSFGNYITPGTMRQSIENNHLVLSADNLKVDIPAMSEMTDEFLDYNVSNAGNSNTIRELIYGDGKAIISFAHWSFTFTQSSFEQFGL